MKQKVIKKRIDVIEGKVTSPIAQKDIQFSINNKFKSEITFINGDCDPSSYNQSFDDQNNNNNNENEIINQSGEWLAIGSSLRYISLWNIPSYLCISTMPSSSIPYNAIFEGCKIISVGSDQHISHWNLSGQLLLRIPSSSSLLLNLITLKYDNDKLLVTSGNSPYIDLFSDFSHKMLSLSFQ